MSHNIEMRMIPKNKRDKYRNIIKITYETINSLRKIDLFVEPEDNKVLYAAIKEVLLLAMNRTDGHKYCEVALLTDLYIDKDTGNYKKLIVYGDDWHVPISKNKDYLDFVSKSSYATLIAIHNHPNGLSFS